MRAQPSFGCAQKLQFFSNFGVKTPQNLGNKHFSGKIMAHSGRYVLHKNWHFFQFWANSQYNLYCDDLKSWHISGHSTKNECAQKLQFFSGFSAKIAQNLGNKHFFMILEPENGTYRRTRNSRAKRRTSACIGAALRIMRAASPTRHNVVMLLRRDVFALIDLRVDLRQQPCAHFKGGLRSKPPGVYAPTHTWHTYARTWTWAGD